MTPIEYADKLRLQLEELKRANKPLVLAATSVTSEMHERIFNRGQASGSGSLGEYNDKRILYLNPDKVFGGSKIGKPGKFENGNDRKTVKLTYKGYKSKLGKPSGGAFKNLELTGDLQSEFVNRVLPKERNGASAPADPNRLNVIEVNVNEYQIRLSNENFKKVKINEAYIDRPIFTPSFGERLLAQTLAELELRRMFA